MLYSTSFWKILEVYPSRVVFSHVKTLYWKIIQPDIAMHQHKLCAELCHIDRMRHIWDEVLTHVQKVGLWHGRNEFSHAMISCNPWRPVAKAYLHFPPSSTTFMNRNVVHHNIVQIQNNIMQDWQYSTDYSWIFPTFNMNMGNIR